MNKNVDVLAVMDSALGDLMVSQVGGMKTETAVPEISSAIDEVAELIEAAEQVHNVCSGQEDWGRLYAALAHVKGGAA